MPADSLRARTVIIVERYRAARSEIQDGGESLVSVEQTERLEGLVTETLRLLRDNKAACVRQEQEGHERGEDVDLRYDDVKAEIDQVVGAMLDAKAHLRLAKQRLHTPNATSRAESLSHEATGLGGELARIAALRQQALLTEEEFTAAKARLLDIRHPKR